MTRASVLIPIHDKTLTLPLTVDTVLRQSVTDLEVLLIGDGVTDDVRRVVTDLMAADARVRFLDFPKGPHHGEIYRHDAVEAAASEAIFYLCDDDLLLPTHVEDLLALLEDHDLAQCLNGYVTTAGEVRLYAADLADPKVVEAHLREDIRYNAVSVTGTAHTRGAYRRVSPWSTTPVGWWPDHWQFRKMLGPGFRAATSARMTALQFPTSDGDRELWSQAARAAEIEPWHQLATSRQAQESIDRLVSQGERAQLVEERIQLSTMHAELTLASADRAHLQESLVAERASAAATHAELREQVEQMSQEVAVLREELVRWQGHTERLTAIRSEQTAKIEDLRTRLSRKNDTIAVLKRAAGRSDPPLPPEPH